MNIDQELQQSRRGKTALCYAFCPNNGLEGYGWTYQEWNIQKKLWEFKCVGMVSSGSQAKRNESSLLSGAISSARPGSIARFLYVKKWKRKGRGWAPTETKVVGPVIVLGKPERNCQCIRISIVK